MLAVIMLLPAIMPIHLLISSSLPKMLTSIIIVLMQIMVVANNLLNQWKAASIISKLAAMVTAKSAIITNHLRSRNLINSRMLIMPLIIAI